MRSFVLQLLGWTATLAILSSSPIYAETKVVRAVGLAREMPSGYNTGERSPALDQAALFVTSFSSDQSIFVFDKQDKLVQTISLNIGKGQGSSMAVDRSGNLYVAPLDHGFIRIYQSPAYSHFSQLDLPKGSAISGIAIDQHTGILAALRCNCAFGGGGQIYFFRPGSSRPCNIVPTPALGTEAIFDRGGTLFFFVEGGSGQPSYVASMAGECTASSISQLTFQIPIYPYGTFAVNKDNNLVIQSYGSPPGSRNAKSLWPIYTYSHPVNNVFPPPLSTTILNEYGNSETQETFYAISGDGHHLWGEGFKNGLREFPYPKGGPAGHFISNLYGQVAVNPPLVP